MTETTRFRIWLACVLLGLWIVSILVTSFVVLEASRQRSRLSPRQSAFVLAVANFPHLVRRAFTETVDRVRDTPSMQLVDRQAVEQPWWVRRFPAPEDSGYLLWSGVDPEVRRSAVRLVRIADGRVLGRWDPAWRIIHARSRRSKPFGPELSETEMRATHPVLLDDGSIIFSAEESMVRQQACKAEPEWVLDHVMHHSVERALDDSVWGPSIADEPLPGNQVLRKLRPDSLARVSFDGELRENRSFGRILESNGLRALLLGSSGIVLNEDPIHLNEIVVAQTDGARWLRGDLLLSARHLSAIFIYRPSTDRIVWYRQGPWMNQHSPQFIDDHRISVFDNNVYAAAPDDDPFVMPGEINRVLVYDFATDQVTEPFAALLNEARPVTRTEGRAQLLADGGLFLEESNAGRILRFTGDRLLWSQVSDYDATRIGVLSWSRYLTAEQAAPALRALAATRCAGTAR